MALICPRCKAPMREEKRSFHKQRKFICPKCGKVRFQQPTDKKRDRKAPQD